MDKSKKKKKKTAKKEISGSIKEEKIEKITSFQTAVPTTTPETEEKGPARADDETIDAHVPEPVKEVTSPSMSTSVEPVSGMKFKISSYSEFRPVHRKSPNILNKIKMFDEQGILLKRPELGGSVANLREQFEPKKTTSMSTFKFVKPVPSPRTPITPDLLLGQKVETFSKLTTAKPFSKSMSNLNDPCKESDSLSVASDDSTTPLEPFSTAPPARSALKLLKDCYESCVEEAKSPDHIGLTIIDTDDPNPEEIKVQEIRKSLEAEVEKAKLEVDRDITSPRLVSQVCQRTRKIAAFAEMIHAKNEDFIQNMGLIEKKKLSKQKSLYKFASLNPVDETVSPDDINLERLSKVPNFSDFKSVTKVKKTVSFEENENWNRFLRDIGRLSVEIDDESESFL